MGWMWITAGLGAFAATLAAGMWTGWMLRGEHEDSRAEQLPARDGGRGSPPVPGPRPPLSPFPGQFLLDIQDEPPRGGRTWLDALLEENGVSRDRG